MLRFQPPATPSPSPRHKWPEFSLNEPATVFSPRPALRKLVVVIDHDLLEALALSRSSELSLLGGLLSHPYIEVFRISDDGPPDAVEWRTTRQGTKFVPGWIVLGDPPAGRSSDIPFVQATEDGENVIQRTLVGNAPDLAAADSHSTAYQERGASEAAAQRTRDVRALEAAQEAGADLFITERSYLASLTWELARQVVVASPESALPLVGLYLRRQGSFLSYRSADGTASDFLSRGLFYWVGTRDLLPAGWRWFSACVQAEEDQLIYLGQSLFQRVQRALQDRDAVLWALNQPQDNDTADEALDGLDGVLLGLMGAVDVTARIAHRALRLKGSEYQAGWQSKRWMSGVAKASSGLASLVAPGTPGANTVEILRLLRNSIHGAALQPLAVSSLVRRDATLVGLPPNDAQRLVIAMDAVGGRHAFGLRITSPDRIHADPGKLTDAILARTVELLNMLMEETPVENFTEAPIPSNDAKPPNDEIFGSLSRESIRLQLGLERSKVAPREMNETE
jgi:hypothetical protein